MRIYTSAIQPKLEVFVNRALRILNVSRTILIRTTSAVANHPNTLSIILAVNAVLGVTMLFAARTKSADSPQIISIDALTAMIIRTAIGEMMERASAILLRVPAKTPV